MAPTIFVNFNGVREPEILLGSRAAEVFAGVRVRDRLLPPPCELQESAPDIDWAQLRSLIAHDLRGRFRSSDTEDLVQNAIVKFAARVEDRGIDGIGSIAGYALTVGRNLAKDQLAARSRHHEIPAGSSVDLDIVRGTPVFQEASAEREQRTERLELTAKVAPNVTKAMHLFLQGHTFDEIAQMTGRTLEVIYFGLRSVALKLHADVLRSTVDNITQDDDEDDSIVDTFKTLGKRQADVLMLSAEGHKPRAIAQTLGINSGAVRASKSIAIRAIRQAVGPVCTEEILNTVLRSV